MAGVRKIPVYGAPGIEPGKYDDADVAPGRGSYQDIRARVAEKYALDPAGVELWVLQGTERKRVIQRHLPNVPGPQQQVIAVVKAAGATRATEMQLKARQHVVTPNPVSMLQPTEGLTPVDCFAELFDNGIRAGASSLELKLVGGQQLGRQQQGTEATLTYVDNGSGMPRGVAENYLRMGYSNSGVVDAARVIGQPLALASYFSKNMSRHGKGALALLYFGHKIVTHTKTAGSSSTTCVEFDLDKEIARYNKTKDPEYLATVTELLDLTESPEALAASFTETAISALQERVRPLLVDASRVADWAQQLAGVYYFFIHGLPQQLWDTLPPELRATPPAAAAAASANGTSSSRSRAAAAASSSSGSSSRPQGGLTLKLFGHSIDQHALRGACPLEPPPVAVMLEAFFSLQQQVQQEDGRQLLPFWLPVRWCEEGMTPDDEPRRAKPNPAYTAGLAQDGADDDGTAGVAGQLKGCFRDFLVLLLYFPRRRGVRTKPELYLQGSELCLFPIWSGRLIPEATCLKEMPAFVGEATSSGDASAFKLGTARLGGVVFCSPEVYTTNNKTNFKDDAYKVFMELGSSKPSSIDSSSRGRLHIWDAQQARGRGRWIPGKEAPDLLLRHFNANWALLERDGQLLDGQQCGAERRGIKYKLADRDDPLMAGALVRLRSADEVRQADAAAVAGAGSPAGAAPAAPASGRKKGRMAASSQKVDQWPSAMGGPQFGIIIQFIDQGADSGQQHFVELREWAPDWADAAGVPKRRLLISSISPLAATNTEADRQAQQLLQQWQREAPHHLAWYNARNSKPVERAEDLPDTHGNSTFAPSQVPDVLQVCFATQANELAAMDKRKWGDQMALHKQHFTWEIVRQQDGDQYERIAEVPCKYFDSKTTTNKSKVQLGGEDGQGLSHYCQEAGSYKIVCRPGSAEDCPWVRQPLSWEFAVHDDQASSMEVSFVAAGPHKVRLGEVLPEVVVRLADQTGRRLAMPFSGDDADVLARRALKVELRLRDESAGGGGLRIKLNQQRGMVTAHLNTLRTELHLKNLKIIPQSLGSNGTGVRRSEVQMKLWVQLQLPGRPGVLEPQHPADLWVLSGPPASLVPDEPSLDASARGSRVVLPLVGILDAQGNRFCAGGQMFTAAIGFEPPDSAKLWENRTAAAAQQLEQEQELPDAAGAGSSGAAAAAAAAGGATPPNRRKRSRPEAVRSNLPGLCSIDGNIIDLKADYRWQASPGSCPKVLLWLFNGRPSDILRQSKAQEPLLELALDAPMHDMFVVFDHGLISKDMQTAALATRRRLVREGKAARQLREEAYELNTGDGLQRVPLGSGQSREFRLLPPKVVERLDLGYELRQDVLDGQLVNVFVAPDGSVLRPSQPGSSLVMPESLVQNWNRVVSQAQTTFEVAFALAPDTRQLADLVIRACNSQDSYDTDFTARIQVVRSAAPDEPLFADVSPPLFIAGGQLRLPTISIDRSWFASSSRGTATFIVRDADSGEGRPGGSYQLGRFHVRLLPAAELLLVMAAGQLFEGAQLTLFRDERMDRICKRQLLTGRGQQSIGAWAPWEVTNASAHGASSSASARQTQEHIHPVRSIVPNSIKPLPVRLGQPVVLHFVATDLQGCPARLSQQQAADMQQAGLQLRPSAAAAAAAAAAPQDASRAEAVAWSWDGQQGVDTAGAAAGSSSAAAAAGARLPPGHLGGYCVNAVTFKVLAGCGAAELVLTLPGSCGAATELVVPLAVQAGPTAVNGLCLSITQQPPQQLQPGRAAAALARAELKASRSVGLVDRRTWQEIRLAEQQEEEDQQPAADAMHGLEGPGAGAAGGGAVAVKPEPGQPPEIQIVTERRHRVAAQDGVINLVSSDAEDEEEEEAGQQQHNVPSDLQDQQRQRQQQHRQQQLAGLDRSAAVLLHRVTAQEGCRLLLQLSLRDAGGHVTSDSSDQRLQLVQHVGWQQGAAVPQPRTRPLQQVAFKSGHAELCLNVGLGDGWRGQQLFELQLSVPPGPAAGGRDGGSSNVVSVVLPVLLQLDVLPGPFPCSLEAATDVIADLGCAVAEPTAAAAAAAEVALTAAQLARLGGPGLLQLFSSSCASAAQVAVLQPPSAADAAAAGSSSAAAAASGGVALPALRVRVAAHDGQTLAPESLQQLSLRLLRWAPSPAAIEAAAAGGGAAVQLAGSCWQEVQLPDLPLQLTAALDFAADAGANAAVVFQVPAGAVELPPRAGLYRLEASYTVLQELRDAGLPAVPPLSMGPFLMLPGQPRALVTAQQLLQQQQQQQQQQRPPSSNRDPRRRGKLAAAAAAAAPAVLADPAPVQTQIVLLKDLGSTVTQQMRLLLVDSLGNACCPAAAQLLAAAAAADARPAADAAAAADAAGSSPDRPAKRQRVGPAAAAAPAAGWQVQLVLCRAQQPGAPGGRQRSLDGQQDETVAWTANIGADGSVVVPTMQLGQLGLAAEGDYQLLARAVRLLPAAASAGGAQQAGAVPELLLAAYTVVAEDQAALKRKQLRLRQARAELTGRVQQLSVNVQQLQEHVVRQQMGLRELGAQRDAEEAAANATAARLQALGGAGRLQDQPHRLLRWSPRLLHPRAIAARGGLENATEGAVNALLPSNQSVQLVQSGAVLGPLVCLGAVEQQDVARLLTALVRSDLSLLVAVSGDASEQLRRNRQQALLLTHPQLVSDYPPDPNCARQHLQRSNPRSFYLHHPQALNLPGAHLQELLSGLLEWDRYDPAAGFIGFADNLLRLNQQQLQVQVPVPGRYGSDHRLVYDGRLPRPELLGLRQTLFYHKLANIMVFETHEHMAAFERRLITQKNQALPRWIRLVALDGSTSNMRRGVVGHCLSLPERPGDLLFAGLAADDVAGAGGGGPLDLRLRARWELEQQLRLQQMRVEELQQEQLQLNKELAEQQRQLAAAQQSQTREQAEATRQQQLLDEQLREVEQQQQQQQQARAARG